METKIKITDNLKSWLGVTKKETYLAIMKIGNHGRYYTITNKVGRVVDIPGWAAVII